MIPWATFESAEYDPDWHIALTEYNLYHYVERGPTQLTRGLDSSMLEQALERQFAISQLGLVSAGFELEHTARIEHTLQTLFHYFSSHQDNGSVHHPASPHLEHLHDFRSSRLPPTYEPLSLFDSEQSFVDLPTTSTTPSISPLTTTSTLPETPATIPVPSLTSTVDMTSKSPLALVNIMNPEIIESRPSKRKYSGSHSPPVVDVDSPENLSDIDNEILFPRSMDYVRASKSYTPRMTRTHREARMRRLSPLRKPLPHHQRQHTYEAEEAETEAHLLLSFSHQCAKVAS